MVYTNFTKLKKNLTSTMGMAKMNSIKTVKHRKQVVDEETVRVAANFRRLRKLNGWTLRELAEKVTPHVSISYISQLERPTNGRGLGKRARRKFAKIFNVDVNEFLKPLTVASELNTEIAYLIEDLKKHDLDKIRHLRKLVPLLLMGEMNEGRHGRTKGK